MQEGLRPGISENELWARLHASVIAQDGDYVETRLLSSGPRTNPWFQETGRREIRNGDLVALDTDVVGPEGYYADFSRTFFGAPGRPSAGQRKLYRLAYEQIQTNIALIRPGMSFRELAEKAWPIPEAYVGNRYSVLAHGVGMTGEYPYICHRQDLDAAGYDGLIEPGMTLCVESYIGVRGWRRGGEAGGAGAGRRAGSRGALALSVRRGAPRPRGLSPEPQARAVDRSRSSSSSRPSPGRFGRFSQPAASVRSGSLSMKSRRSMPKPAGS
jgi:Metallopeptidase family M24